MKIIIISVISLAALVGLGNLAFNYWLQHKLPDFIKNNSDYKISYNNLSVQLETGNIIATGLEIKTKNTDNQNITNINGTIDTLKINRLGIWDALVRRKINSSNLYMAKPNLSIRLAKTINDKTGKQNNPIGFQNIKISNGNIIIHRNNHQKFLSVNQLNLAVSNLKMTEQSVENQLPIALEKYSIGGKNFFYNPDEIYIIKAQNISTKNGIMSIDNFELSPNFAEKSYADKNTFFDLKINKINLKQIIFKNNKISLSEIKLQHPNITIYTENKGNQATKKPMDYTAILGKLEMNNAMLNIVKPNGTKQLSIKDFNLNINNLEVDKTSIKEPIPFRYKNFNFNGKNTDFNTDNQLISLSEITLNPKLLKIKNGVVKSTVYHSNKTSTNAKIYDISLKINEFGFIDKKLKLNATSLDISKIFGNITAPKKPTGKKANFDAIAFPLTIEKINLGESEITLKKGNNETKLKHLSIKANQLIINEQTIKQTLPFSVKNYEISTKNLDYKINKFYALTLGKLHLTKQSLDAESLAVKPLVSRAQFIKMIPVEKDLYNLNAKKISLNGKIDLLSETPFIDLEQAEITGLDANIFRSKIPPDDPSIKAMYSEQLRNIKFPLYIKNLDIKQSVLVYEEDTPKSNGPGKLVFADFNMNVKNLNSGKFPNRPTQIPISIQCRFMNASPMSVNWTMNTANRNDDFSISGQIVDLPATSINAFVEPYLNIKTEGEIKNLRFDFKGNKHKIDGTMNMKYQQLKVTVLKDSGEKNKLLSTLANLLVKSNSNKFPESVTIENVERNPTKSFFNLFWQGIQSGLKDILITRKSRK
ncbi:MAG: hypothetical protein Q4G16_01575 [Cruoricaptor ignavus]|nr:hypothetical protein [Cruoricaptor ignavus]